MKSLVSGLLIASITSKSGLPVTTKNLKFVGKQPLHCCNDEQNLQSNVDRFVRFARLSGSTFKARLLSRDIPNNLVACPIDGGSDVNWLCPRDRTPVRDTALPRFTGSWRRLLLRSESSRSFVSFVVLSNRLSGNPFTRLQHDAKTVSICALAPSRGGSDRRLWLFVTSKLLKLDTDWSAIGSVVNWLSDTYKPFNVDGNSAGNCLSEFEPTSRVFKLFSSPKDSGSSFRLQLGR